MDQDDPWSGILVAMMFAVRATFHTTLQALLKQLVFGRDAILNIKHITDWEHIPQPSKESLRCSLVLRLCETVISPGSCCKVCVAFPTASFAYFAHFCMACFAFYLNPEMHQKICNFFTSDHSVPESTGSTELDGCDPSAKTRWH
jgi:hypothetical protein